MTRLFHPVWGWLDESGHAVPDQPPMMSTWDENGVQQVRVIDEKPIVVGHEPRKRDDGSSTFPDILMSDGTRHIYPETCPTCGAEGECDLIPCSSRWETKRV